MQRLEAFLQNYHTKKFSKGEIILVEGEEPTCAYFVKKGVTKTYNITADGQEKPIAFNVEFEPFPTGWVFKKQRYSQYYYEAFTDSELYCVPRDDFLEHIRSDADLLYAIFDNYIKRYLNYNMRVYALEQSKAAEKVVNTLHFLSLRFGRDIAEDVVKIDLPLTQQELANFMGLTRETTGIELKKLEKQGIIDYRRQSYIVHTNKLNDLLAEEYDHARLIEDEKHVIKKQDKIKGRL